METEKEEPTMNGAKTHRMTTSLAGTQPRAEIMDVTPALARKWLGQNTANNRNVSPRTVASYAVEMKAGRWQLTHQGIAFNQTGELVDGQHRLHAIIEADTPVKAYVITGIPLEYNSAIDQGYNRRVEQILGLSGRRTSAIRALRWMEQGFGGTVIKAGLGSIGETNEHHTNALDAVLTVVGNERMSAQMVGVLAYAHPIDPERILQLTRQIATGEMIRKGDPAYKLRSWYERERRASREVIMATSNVVKHFLLRKELGLLVANLRNDRQGISGYLWICQKRRALRQPWTPAYDGPSKNKVREDADEA